MILVTGSTGNVGSQLIPALRGAGEQVRALVHDESKGQPLRDVGAEVVVGDMERPETLGKAVAGVDKVYLITRPAGKRERHRPGALSRPPKARDVSPS